MNVTVNPISRVFLGLALILLSSVAQAQLCRSVYSNPIAGLLKPLKISQVEAAKPKIKKMILQLVELNMDSFLPHINFANLGPSRFWRIESLELVEPKKEIPKYLVFDVILSGNAQKRSFRIRTNGRVAFIAESWRYRIFKSETPKYFRAVYFENGELKSADQGEAILSSLPDSIHLSRSMSWTERQRWLNGEDFWSQFGQKIHFAPNYYKFTTEPYLIPFTKRELLEYYQNGQLEVNTYDHIGGTKPPQLVWTNLGLEFELVFVGKQTVEKIKPKMREHLRQEQFSFPKVY